jgi:hypothetical protein
MTDSKRSGNSPLRSKLRGIKPTVIEMRRVELKINLFAANENSGNKARF